VSETTEPRTIIICLPTSSGSDYATVVQAVTGRIIAPTILTATFPVRHRRLSGVITRWSSRHLIGAQRRRGVVHHAAGGRLARLHLRQAGHLAWYEAATRWGIWRQVTTGLRQASPWEMFLRRHEADPDKLSLTQARQQYLAQPMISAMLAHNADPTSRCQLDPYELDAYLAGASAYATRHMLAATCGQAMLTADGRWLQPDSGCFADVCAYLKAAAAHLHQLHTSATVLAITSH
jgi:hypothetical protein